MAADPAPGSPRGEAGEAFAVALDEWNVNRLLQLSSRRYREHWLVLLATVCLLALVFFSLASTAAALEQWMPEVWNAGGGFFAYGILEVLRFLLLVGLLRLMVDVVRRREVRISVLLLPFRRLGALMVVELATFLTLLAVLALFFAADQLLDGIIADAGARLIISILGWGTASVIVAFLGCILTFAGLELLCDLEVGSFGAIRRSWQMTRKMRWRFLGVILLAGLELVLGLVLLGAGFALTLGLAMALLAALFLTLRGQLGLPPIAETDLPPPLPATAD